MSSAFDATPRHRPGHANRTQTDGPVARAAAIARAVESLLEGRRDEATARFDSELTGAVVAGRLDEATARTLRWWQRASVRAAEGYVADLLPGVLHADDSAQRRSRAEAEFAAASWRQATRAHPGADAGNSASEPAEPDTQLRVRLVATPLEPARTAPSTDECSTVPPDGKDTSGHDHPSTSA